MYIAPIPYIEIATLRPPNMTISYLMRSTHRTVKPSCCRLC